MAKHCIKCGGLLVQGTETCIICGKFVAPINLLASNPKAQPISQSGTPASVPDPYIRFVTDPRRKPIVIPVAHIDHHESTPNSTPDPPSTPPSAAPGPYIRFVTAPGGRRIEDTSTAKIHKKIGSTEC